MEDPIRFDVWAILADGDRNPIKQHLAEHRPELGRLELVRAINAAATNRQPLLVLSAVTWSEAVAFRSASPDWVSEVSVCQQSYEPDCPHNHYCAEHSLYFGGCLGCHVCSGFYVA